MAQPYNGILFGHKKEWGADTYYNIEDSQKHSVKWKKPDRKGHILYNSTHMKCPE